MLPRTRLLLSAAALVGVFLIGTLGYTVLEDVPFFDAAYMTAITLSTVGFRESIELDHAGKLWTLLVIVVGVGTVSVAFTSLISVVVSGDVRDVLRRRKLQTQIEQLKGHVILCGYGRMGALASEELKRQGVAVVVVERNPEAILKLERENTAYVRGDATEEETLLRAGIQRSRVLVAVLPHDADNLYVTLTARGLRPDMTIIARAEQPAAEAKLKRAGATRVVCPQVVGASKVAAFITRPNVVDVVEVASKGVELEMDEYVVGPDSPLNDMTLRSAPIRDKANAIVVAIKRRDGATIYHPAPAERIQSGDTLIMIGPAGVSRRLQSLGQPG